jgi:hypothetical protein
MRACRLQETADLALNLALGALQGWQSRGGRRGQSAPPACIGVQTPCSAGPEQAAARAVQFSPLYGQSIVRLTVTAVHEVSNGCWQAQGVRAQLQPERVTIADLADGPGRQHDLALITQRRKVPRTRGCLLCLALQGVCTLTQAGGAPLQLRSAGWYAALQRPERKVQCQVNSFLQPACVHARGPHGEVGVVGEGEGVGEPKQTSGSRDVLAGHPSSFVQAAVLPTEKYL